MTVPPAAALPLRVKLGHGFGSAAYGVKDNGFSTLLLIFYNQVMGLDPGLIGLILLAALLLDALVDPLVGYFSDKTHSRWGQRHPWLYGSILPMALCWTLLWYPPLDAGNMLYAYLFVFAFLMRASVSCYEVPALSVVPALSADYDERTSITRWRFLFGWGGGLFMLVLAFGVFLVPEPGFPIGQLNINGYQRYGLAGAALIIVATIVSALTTHRRLARMAATPPVHLPPGETLRKIAKTLANRPYLILVGATLFAYANTGVAFSLTTYLFTYVWEMPQSGFLAYSATLFLGVICAFLVVGFLQSRIEKRTGAVVLGLLGVAIAITPYSLRLLDLFPENGSAMLIPLLFFLLTLGNSCAVGAMMLGQSMATDVIEASQEKTGERSEGIFFAGYFFTQKCATGVGLFLSGAMLSLVDFPDAAKPGQVAMPVLDNLVLANIIVTVVLGLASSALVARFPISRADHEERVRMLAVASVNRLD